MLALTPFFKRGQLPGCFFGATDWHGTALRCGNRLFLALAHLVAAWPIGQSKASVVPFSQSAAEFAQARRALTATSWTIATLELPSLLGLTTSPLPRRRTATSRHGNFRGDDVASVLSRAGRGVL